MDIGFRMGWDGDGEGRWRVGWIDYLLCPVPFSIVRFDAVLCCTILYEMCFCYLTCFSYTFFPYSSAGRVIVLSNGSCVCTYESTQVPRQVVEELERYLVSRKERSSSRIGLHSRI